MSTMISFEDNSLSNSFLSMDEVRALCPYAFKEEPTNPNVSKKYIQANTATVLDDLSKLGWYPVQAKQCRNKKGSKGIRSFHMIALQNPNIKILKPDGEGNLTVDAYPRIILTNSHDSFNSFKFMLGLYRVVCSNGIVIATDEMVNMSIRHINYTFEGLREIVNKAIENVPNIINTMNEMKNTILSEDDKKELAAEAIRVRKEATESTKFDINEETIMDILNPTREEDKGDDLWTVFNVCQEKIIKGGYSDISKNGKSRKQRPITSIKKDVDFNQKLWAIATRYMPSASAA